MKEQLQKSSSLNDFVKECHARHTRLVADSNKVVIKEATVYIDCCKEYPPVVPKHINKFQSHLDLTHIFRFNEMTVESTYFNGYFWITEEEMAVYLLMTE